MFVDAHVYLKNLVKQVNLFIGLLVCMTLVRVFDGYYGHFKCYVSYNSLSVSLNIYKYIYR